LWRDLLSVRRIQNEATETTNNSGILTDSEEYARKRGWVLNSDKKILSTVIRGLARNEKKFGERYCPCRLRSGDKEKDKANICPCIYHEAEIAKDGHCLCQLFFTKDTAEKNRKT
jgi:ferredoxin-thioredoxin reductase catalytic subunit